MRPKTPIRASSPLRHQKFLKGGGLGEEKFYNYSTVTLFAKFRG